MKGFALLFACLSLFLFVSTLFADDASNDNIYLLRIDIKGNVVTSEAFIRSRLTLQPGKTYEIDTIIDEINRSRTNLEKTGLFANVFFNDELDEDNNLLLTIQIREKNYLLFGVGGYFGYEDSEFYSVTSLYVKHTNIGGTGDVFSLEVPVYRDYGVITRYAGYPGKIEYTLGLDVRYNYFYDENIQKLLAGLGYNVNRRFLIGLDIHSHRSSPADSADSTLSFVFLPNIRWGLAQRSNEKLKKWHSLYITPYAGVSVPGQSEHDTTQFYGIDGRLSLNWDVLLQIVYALNLHASYQDGTVPNEYRVTSNIRGSNPDFHSGTYRLTAINNVDFPLPTDNRIHFVPFLDYGLVGGDDETDFLIGGGIGLHWYTKFQDPFVFEVAYGEGFMINLSKNF
jgi:outer membrane protein assembly factor BamA